MTKRRRKKQGNNRWAVGIIAVVGVIVAILAVVILQPSDSDEQAADSGGIPSWQQVPLTNARTGETFTLADFQGQKNVVVKLMSPT